MKRVERFDQTALLIQDFKCQKHDHMSRNYPSGVRCAEYNQAHDTRDHEELAPAAPKACASYNREGHTAYCKTYPVASREKQRTMQRIANKAPLYEYQREATIKPQEDTADHTIVVYKKKRKAQANPVELREGPSSQ